MDTEKLQKIISNLAAEIGNLNLSGSGPRSSFQRRIL